VAVDLGVFLGWRGWGFGLYGGGAGASGGTFPISAGSIAPSRLDAPSASYPDVAGGFLQAGQTMASTQLTEQKIETEVQKTDLTQTAAAIAKTNPMLDKGVLNTVTNQIQATAELKAAQDGAWLNGQFEFERDGKKQKLAAYEAKMSEEVLGLFNKNSLWKQGYELGKLDVQIKNAIFESKEFQNDLLELQRNWLKNADFHSGNIMEAAKMLLMFMK